MRNGHRALSSWAVALACASACPAARGAPPAPTASSTPAPMTTPASNPTTSPGPSEAAVRIARDLYRQAMAAQDRGDHADALAKLRRVADVRTTPTVLFYISYNEEKMGQLVPALEHMRRANQDLEATAADRHAAQSADAMRLLPFARTELAALEMRVPRLRLHVTPASVNADAARLTIDGNATRAPSWDRVPVAPGPHRLLVEAPGFRPASTDITAAESATVEASLSLAPLEATPAPAPVAARAPSSDTSASAPRSHAAAIATTAGAVVLVGGGIASFAVAAHDASSARARCAAETSCSPPRTAIRTFDALALGAWIGGAGLAALSVVLWSSPGSASPSPASSASTHLSIGPAQVALGGSF